MPTWSRAGRWPNVHAEPCLSPSAVSHRIARLEQALTELSQALQQAPAAEFSGSVALYARPSIAQCWLVPRLADFHRRYPDIALDVRVGNDPVDFRTQHVDLALLYADGRFPGLVSQPLMSEALAPVCSPRYAEQHGLLASPENLRQCTLLHDARAWENAAFDAEWQLWARHCGLREALPTQALTFDRSDLCVTAAINHAGVAIGRQRLVQRSLDQGELLLPFGGFSQTGRYDYFLVHPRRVPMPGRVQVLIDWLQECARQSG